ncbi:MAG: pyruvate ferredoxin oxidoreductase, partial [Chloroflexota bacterium]
MRLLDGNQAAAEGAKLSRVQVIAAYPITPQTPVTEALSEFVERGELKSEYIAVE